MPINLEKHEIAIILDALSERPHKEVVAIINKIVHQMAEEQIKEETELRRRKRKEDYGKSKSVFYGDAER